jgi:dolichyl-phosphate beta-glucosyltransferase
VVIPAFNEETRIGDSLKKVTTFLDGRDIPFEILVVDDGSTDATESVVKHFADSDRRVKLITNDRNRGKGYSVRRGVQASKGDVVLFSDADLSTPIEEYDRLLPHLKTHDLVIASRSLAGSNVIVHQAFYREMMGRIFNIIVQVMLVRGIIDTQCGFKLMTRRAASDIFARTRIDSFSFDVEMILVAKKHGFAVIDVPVQWKDSRGSKVHPIRDSAHMLLDLLRIKLYDIAGFYAKRIERE